MIVGGRDFNQRKIDVEQAMKGEFAEAIREHFVVVNGTPYPPKQVLAHVTGWDRTSFTTMEAQRVLKKLDFECVRALRNRDGMLAWFEENEHATADKGDEGPAALLIPPAVDRLAATEAALATAQTAIAGLAARVTALEAR